MNTTDRLAFAAIIISIATFIFSWYSFSKTDKLAKTTFNKNYRPYITASNFYYLDNNNLAIPAMNVVMLKIMNAPALIKSKKLKFYIRENNIDILLFEHPDYQNELIYPLDNSQYTIGTDQSIISHTIAEKLYPKKIIRKIRLEYQWISDSDLKYYFESEWEYNVQKQNWDIISQDAN